MLSARVLLPAATVAFVAVVAAGCGEPDPIIKVEDRQLAPEDAGYQIDFRNQLNLVISEFVQIVVYDATGITDAQERADFCEQLKDRRRTNNLDSVADKKNTDSGLISTCELLNAASGSNDGGLPGVANVKFGARAILVTAHNEALSRGTPNDFIYVGCGVSDFSTAAAAAEKPVTISMDTANRFIPYPPSSPCQRLADRCSAKCKALP